MNRFNSYHRPSGNLKTVFWIGILWKASLLGACATEVQVSGAVDHPQVRYATERLVSALEEAGHRVNASNTVASVVIRLSVTADDATLESDGAYRRRCIRRGGKTGIEIRARHGRGVMYGALGLAREVTQGTALSEVEEKTEKPHYAMRGIKFNLPWQSYRKSDALALHREVCRDLEYWESFLDMMAENRFNTLSLWNLHPFNLMIRNEKYPEACGFTDVELAEWQTFWHRLFAMANERGIETYMVTWNIFVSPEFAKAHDVADYCKEDMDAHYIGPGDSSEIIKDYMRTSVTQLIDTYPGLTGLGISLGERMKGLSSTEREQWVMDTYIEGMMQAKRKARFIHRLPFSAKANGGDSTDSSTEQLTRDAIESLELPGPIWVEAKYNWSHAHSTPTLVHVHGGALKDTYWNPPPKNYKVTWMARNEDFFALRWGQPDFIREHIALNSQEYVGGYFVGSECYIPAVDYFTKSELSRPWDYAFERQWMFYDAWGQLLYNPATPDAYFAADTVQRLGPGGDQLFAAQKLVSQTPLRIASFYRSSWDYTLYSEGVLSVHVKDENRFITVDELIKSSVLDPSYLSIRDFVQQQKEGRVDSKRVTPLQLANWMERDANEALALLAPLAPAADSELAYEIVDVKAWAYLSLYFAEKLRGGVALQTYRTRGDKRALQEAADYLDAASGYWSNLISVTLPVYAPMPLGHLKRDGNVSPDWHWSDYQSAVDQERDSVKKLLNRSVEYP